MADDPLTITEVYPGYRRGGQDPTDACCCLIPIVCFLLLGLAIMSYVVPDMDARIGHLAVACLSTMLLWAVVINPWEDVVLTMVLSLVIGFLLGLAWQYLPNLMTGVSTAIAVAVLWINRSDAKQP